MRYVERLPSTHRFLPAASHLATGRVRTMSAAIRVLSPAAGTVNAFRLPGTGGSGPPWPSDEAGGAWDPGDPDLTRRDFLIQVAVATAAVAVGGALNILTMMLAR